MLRRFAASEAWRHLQVKVGLRELFSTARFWLGSSPMNVRIGETAATTASGRECEFGEVADTSPSQATHSMRTAADQRGCELTVPAMSCPWRTRLVRPLETG